MAQEDFISAREFNCVKFAMDVSGAKKTPQARAAHIADAAAGTEVATINAILVVLENLGFVATA